MKVRVKKILLCELEKAHPEKIAPEMQASFKRWVALRRYKERLKFNLLKGGRTTTHTYIF